MPVRMCTSIFFCIKNKAQAALIKIGGEICQVVGPCVRDSAITQIIRP